MARSRIWATSVALAIFLSDPAASSPCPSEEAFIGAVYSNDMKMIPSCIQRYDVNMKNSKSLTPLMIAANNHYTQVVDYLLDHGADPNLRFSSAEQFFDGAGQVAYGSIVATVLSVMSPAHVSSIVGTVLLGFADRQKIEDAMRNFSFSQLKDFTDAFTHYIPSASLTVGIVAKFGLKNTAVAASSAYAFNGLMSMYTTLSDIRGHSHSYSFTPLMHAVISLNGDDTSVLKSLLSRGANADILTDKCGENALMLAIKSTRSESKLNAVQHLSKHVSNINARTRGYFGQKFYGCEWNTECDISALHMAVKYAPFEVVEFLIKLENVDKTIQSSWLCGGKEPADMKPMDPTSLTLFKKPEQTKGEL